MAAGSPSGIGHGLAVIGIVVADDAVGIGRFIAPNVVQGAVRSRTVVIVGIMGARGGRDGIGSAVDIAAVCRVDRRIDRCIGCVGDGIKTAEGLDEGQTEKDDEQRGDAHNGQGSFQRILVGIEPDQDEVEADGGDEACEQG